MTRALTTNELQAMQLMVGQHSFGFVVSSSLMGHSTLRGSTVYTQADDPVKEFVVSIMTNETGEALAGMDSLIRQFPAFIEWQLGEAGLPYDDQSPVTGIDSAEAFRRHVLSKIHYARGPVWNSNP